MRKRLLGLTAIIALAGCGRPMTPAVPLPHGGLVAAPVTAAQPIPTAPADPDAQAAPGPAPTANPVDWGLLKGISQAGGLINGLGSLALEPEAAYQTQIVPSSTQEDAEERAHNWASDARQAYVGWGFWKTSLLGKTRHLYYSAQRNQVLRLEYTVIRQKLVASVADGTTMKKGFMVMRDSYDINPIQAREAYQQARAAGYRPTSKAMGVLMDLVWWGPVWIFLDFDTMRPVVVVQAETGEATVDGPLFWAVSYIISQGADDSAGPPYTVIPAPPRNP